MKFNPALLTELASTWGPWLITVLVALGIKDIGAAAIRKIVSLWGTHVKSTPDKRDDVVHELLSPALLALADKLDNKGEHRAAKLIRDDLKKP